MTIHPEDLDLVAKAVCAERCASYGEPPCWSLPDVIWDGGKCDNIHDCDCGSIAKAASRALLSSIKEGGGEVLSSVAPLATPSVASRVPEPGQATPSLVWIVMATSGEYSDRSEWPDIAYRTEQEAKDRVGHLTTTMRECFADSPEMPSYRDFDTPEGNALWVEYERWRTAAHLAFDAATGAKDVTSRDTSWFVYEVPLNGPHHAPDTREATKGVSPDATALKDSAPFPSGEKRS